MSPVVNVILRSQSHLLIEPSKWWWKLHLPLRTDQYQEAPEESQDEAQSEVKLEGTMEEMEKGATTESEVEAPPDGDGKLIYLTTQIWVGCVLDYFVVKLV